ncbi:hypothetical protein QTP88_002298 [Uroleucon formosanum]
MLWLNIIIESLVLVETESSIAMVETESSEIFAVEKNTNIFFFSKPKSCNLDLFFDYHPKQPYEEVPFKPKKAYYRPDNTQRQWLSYNSIKKALYCSVCIVFCPHSNAFTEGMITWSHTYQRIDEHENSKDHTDAAEAYFLNSIKKNIDFLLFSKQKSLRKEHIKHNRQILERIIDVVKLIGKRGLSYRGNQSESAYMLDSLSTDHGNFLDILLLLGKYDIHLNDHLKTIIEKSKKAHESGSKGRGGLITFISKTTLNVIIDSISCIIKNKISDAVREAGMYSVEIDTTQDISVMDQCAVVIRFVDKNCVKVNEKLIAIVECSNSSGHGMFELLQTVLKNNNLNLEMCIGNATDGAANMQGIYNGFTAWLEKFSPGQVHVWCYAHILNLAITDVTKCSLEAASLFTLLNNAAVFFKESHKRMSLWKNVVGEKEQRRLQKAGDTRWWAKESALNNIFGSPIDGFNSAMYVCVVGALYKIETSDKFSSDIRLKAKCLKTELLKYSTILTAFIYQRIFEITGPLSKYLQTSGIDLIKSQELVNDALKSLIIIQRDCNGIQMVANKFVKWASTELENKFDEVDVDDLIVEDHLPEIRSRKRKLLPGEVSHDQPILNAYQRFTVEVHNVILDKIVCKIKERFTGNEMLYGDLSCLSPINFVDITANGLPTTALDELCKKLVIFDNRFNTIALKNELLNFAKNWDSLKKTLPEFYIENKNTNITLENDGSSDEVEECDTQNVMKTSCRFCMNCTVCCLHVLVKYNMYSSAYSNLALAYKYLLTLPSTQVASERTFSTLKFIKNRLRSKLSESKLEAFMLMSVEKEVLYNIDTDDIINKVASTSITITKELMY